MEEWREVPASVWHGPTTLHGKASLDQEEQDLLSIILGRHMEATFLRPLCDSVSGDGLQE